ncbi:MAG TPA: ethanolamine ammonia-lyase reactivating factor EutA [Gemmataceae bacterium]|jgi:ethanolamine utilization protein EutA|nr:ethanolamine ammonia-lyase reactivating factor EutA [Gemmataceae bacterium]
MVKLIGLDFGTTTSSAVVAQAELAQNSVTGKKELGHVEVRFRSEMIFTPWQGQVLDVAAIERCMVEWLDAGGAGSDEFFGGAAMLTGLTAQADNATALVRAIRRHLGDAFVATADDPCLESWLAFHGSCAALSRAVPDTPVLNLDIGGGTTNAALGLAGDVLATGCLFVGARHVQVRPGTYEILRLSRYAQALFADLHIAKSVGAELTPQEVDAFVGRQMVWLEAMVKGRPFEEPVAELHVHRPLRLPVGLPSPIVTVSGGVGELLYARRGGAAWPVTTAFGDLGIDLARRLLERSPWSEHFRAHVPASCGRATVFGLLRHSTQISGNTIFLTRESLLPLHDLPILGRIGTTSSDEQIRTLLEMAQRSPRGGGLEVNLERIDAPTLSRFAERLAVQLEAVRFSPKHPLVLFVSRNVGKVFGKLITRWGRLPLALMVVDEIDVRSAQYANLGTLRNQVIPVSVFGLRE